MKIIKNQELEDIKRDYYVKGIAVVLYIYAKKNNIDANWDVCKETARSFLWNVPYDKEDIDDWVNKEIEYDMKDWNILRDLDEERILNMTKERINERKLREHMHQQWEIIKKMKKGGTCILADDNGKPDIICKIDRFGELHCEKINKEDYKNKED